MQVSTTFTIEGYRIIDHKGIVHGNIVHTPTFSQWLSGLFKDCIGGRIDVYTKMCEQRRGKAHDMMVEHARQLGANAVVGVRYDTAKVITLASMMEVYCYGTAVVVEPETGTNLAN